MTKEQIQAKIDSAKFTYIGKGEEVCLRSILKGINDNTAFYIGTASRISITDGVIDISTAYVGQNSITTLGTITAGTWNGTAIGPTYGGTGLNVYAAGDLIYASATNILSKLGIGTSGQVLTVDPSGVPVWAAAAGGGGGIYPGTGTAFTSYAKGDLIYASDVDILSKLPIGAEGKVLNITGGVPTWGNVPVAAGALLADGTIPLTADWTTGAHSIIMPDSLGTSYGKIFYDVSLRALKIQTAYAGALGGGYVSFSPYNGGGAPTLALSSGISLSGTSLISNQGLQLTGTNTNSGNIITINTGAQANGAIAAFTFTNEIRGGIAKAFNSSNRVGIHTGINCTVNHSAIASSYETLRIACNETSIPLGPNYLLRAGLGNLTSTFTSKFDVLNTGQVAIGGIMPTALLHLRSSSGAINDVPLKLTAGTKVSTPEDGSLEYDGTHLYFTIGSTRNILI